MQWVIVPKPKMRIRRLAADRAALMTAWTGIAVIPATILLFGSVGGLENGQWAVVHWVALGLEAVALVLALKAQPSRARETAIRVAGTALVIGVLSQIAFLTLMYAFGE